MDKYVIAVDAMGGDNAPEAVIDGCAQALSAMKNVSIRLFGQRERVEPLLSRLSGARDRVELIDCPEVITMHDEPMLAVRRKRSSSMVMGLMDVKEGRAQAFVSAGSTGALFLGGMAYVRLMRGLDRPALAAVIPGLNNPFLLIDSGANADCQPKYLMQFGLMGSVYMEKQMGVRAPRVGLANIGAEEEKGSRLYKEAHQLMKAQTAYRFCGNCEARDIQTGDFDVVVCDGFTGNVILKYAEGLTRVLFKRMKQTFLSSLRGKLGALLLKPSFEKIRSSMNPDEYGGALLMGLQGVVVKAHGSSGGYAFSRALIQARAMVEADVVGHIQEGLGTLMSRIKEEESHDK